VIERLIDAIANFDYPKNLLEIQVLDDSTDETVSIIAKKVLELQKQGFDIQHIQRENRIGYKAGALAHGLKQAKGEFIVIFDADFVPPCNFLQKTIPHFKNPQVGVVQTRWGHLNQDYSLLTQLQAFGLDAHFVLEQIGRNQGGHFINFNGTAGVWRKSCIEDAGGWSADTLTEDLDLSYRAQLKNWQFLYLPDVISPAELPIEINALKSQQYRWTKGAAECSMKNLNKVIKAKNISFSTKIHSFFHLMNSSVFVMILFLALLSFPFMFVMEQNISYNFIFKVAGIFQCSWLILGLFYWLSFNPKLSKKSFIVLFPLFLLFMLGLSVHNSIAVIEGWLGRKSAFIRTPKFNVEEHQLKQNQYLSKQIPLSAWLELFMFFYALLAFSIGIYLHFWGMLAFHLMLMLGFGMVFYYSVKKIRFKP
jgi:cellulose synthase/poly-beta-1,6-N-acetylglucosamine synthase-like glycosyltransferase